MFEYFRLKKAEMRVRYLLLSKVYDVVESLPDIAALATELKGLDPADLQKSIVEKLVEFVKDKNTEA